ncbi:MAG TPA: NAD(P)/FAD-dependent oxidoreductase [Thermoanaerobaculia bacterium]
MKRLFRGLRQPPEASYDAVVIGSGIGGLVAANLLAKEGLKVLLAEQHYMVGGYCSTFRRGGFTFDASTHFYPLLGNPETLTGRLLAELGVATGWVKMDPVDTFHFPDGTRFAVPADFEIYLAKLKDEFPHEAAALDAFFAAVREVYLLGLFHYFRGRPEPERLAPYRDLTVREALDRWFRDPKLKLLLTADCPHWGSPPGRTSFVFDSMLRLSYFLGNYYPKDGSQAFADELALRFEEKGGHLLTSTPVRRIVVERGAARGVEIETLRGPLGGLRATVDAGVVISNADLLQTFEGLSERISCRPERSRSCAGCVRPFPAGSPISDCAGWRGRRWRRPRVITGIPGTWTASAATPCASSCSLPPSTSRRWRRRADRSSLFKKSWKWTTMPCRTGPLTKRRSRTSSSATWSGRSRGSAGASPSAPAPRRRRPGGSPGTTRARCSAGRCRPDSWASAGRTSRRRSPGSIASATGRVPAAASRR